MIHIYGHSWSIRWGDPDEKKLVKVYSNCETAELFVNNVSCGEKKRNPQNFPAAGLHWLVRFVAGENHLRAVGYRNGTSVVDELRFQYQTERWGSPVRVELSELARTGEAVTVEVRLLDAKNVRCLDARNRVHFGLTGDGTLIDDTGTSKGSRIVELYNGRAEISLLTNGGKSVLSVSTGGIPTAFLSVI